MPTSDRIFYLTGSGQPGFEVEVPQGAPTTETPFGALEPTHTIFSQVYMQRRSAYRRPAPNSICDPSISGGALAYFCDDSPRVPYGIADIVTWTRTWATVPLTFSLYATTSVIYPGVSGVDNGTSLNARPEFSTSTRARLLNEFFLVGNGTRYSNESAIPLNSPTSVNYFNKTTDALEQTLEILGGGVLLQNLGPNASYYSSPSVTTYNTWKNTDSNNATSYTLISEQSTLENYIGNIWRRVTSRVKAI